MDERLIVSHAPHIADSSSVSGIMRHVIVALLPSLVAGCMVFGLRALWITLICVGSCVLFEGIWQRILKKPVTITDGSAVVTGLLLALNLPSSVPLWMPIVGGFFAIIIVKQFFGGLGHNFMNPALAARAFLLASWSLPMTTWVKPFAYGADAVTAATPLALYAEGASALPSYADLFFGSIGGCIGETSTLAILIGAAYLLICGVIRLRVPLTMILTVALGTWIFGGSDGLLSGDALYQILSGGLMLGAFFMATDYTTTPTTPMGQILFGLGAGILTVVIRIWGGYPEGVSYSILLMNVATPLIDRVTAPRTFGRGGKEKEARMA